MYILPLLYTFQDEGLLVVLLVPWKSYQLKVNKNVPSCNISFQLGPTENLIFSLSFLFLSKERDASHILTSHREL